MTSRIKQLERLDQVLSHQIDAVKKIIDEAENSLSSLEGQRYKLSQEIENEKQNASR